MSQKKPGEEVGVRWDGCPSNMRTPLSTLFPSPHASSPLPVPNALLPCTPVLGYKKQNSKDYHSQSASTGIKPFITTLLAYNVQWKKLTQRAEKGILLWEKQLIGHQIEIFQKKFFITRESCIFPYLTKHLNQ